MIRRVSNFTSQLRVDEFIVMLIVNMPNYNDGNCKNTRLLIYSGIGLSLPADISNITTEIKILSFSYVKIPKTEENLIITRVMKNRSFKCFIQTCCVLHKNRIRNYN